MIKKILFGLILLGFFVIGFQAQAIAVDENVCCESFGYGANMIKTPSTYSVVPGSQCSIPLDFVGGGKNIVNMSYCKATPSITVLSPNGDEIYQEGDTVRVSWKSRNLPADYRIHLVFNYLDELKDEYKQSVLITKAQDKGYYDYKLPMFSQYKTSNYPLPGKNYEFTAYLFDLSSNSNSTSFVAVDADSSSHGSNNGFFTIKSSGYTCPLISQPAPTFCPNGTIEAVKDTNQCIVSYRCSTSNNNPVISGVSGPQTLNVGQTGTWKITASAQNNAGLSYSVVWGDEGLAPLYDVSASVKQGFQQSATFTHSYAVAGTYTPTFTVTSENTIRCVTTPCPSNAGSATMSITVKVGNYTTETCPAGCTCSANIVACPDPAEEVCLPGYVYNPLTGKKCSTSTINSCKAGQKYDAITGMLCPQQGINWGMLQRVLKRGVKGNDVALIQAYLGITADGNFGPATEQKVIEWQAQNGLTPDGKFGEKSRLKAELED